MRWWLPDILLVVSDCNILFKSRYVYQEHATANRWRLNHSLVTGKMSAQVLQHLRLWPSSSSDSSRALRFSEVRPLCSKYFDFGSKCFGNWCLLESYRDHTGILHKGHYTAYVTISATSYTLRYDDSSSAVKSTSQAASSSSEVNIYYIPKENLITGVLHVDGGDGSGLHKRSLTKHRGRGPRRLRAVSVFPSSLALVTRAHQACNGSCTS